jgi:hypothetical protein
MRHRALQVVSPAPRQVWQQLLKEDTEAVVFQTPAWLDSLCALGGYEDASRLYDMPGGRQLVLPMVRRKGLRGPLTTRASLPVGWGTGGLVASSPVHGDDIDAVWADLAGQSALYTLVRPNPRVAHMWAAAPPPRAMMAPRLAHVLDLTGGFGRVWAERFASTTRTAVRKAERAGLVVECDTTGKLVPVFYDLLRLSITRWAQQQHEPLPLARWRNGRRDPFHKFELIARALGEACRVWVAWLNGQPAASIVVLQGANASYFRGAIDKELAGPSRANDLLHRLAIEDACRAGCRYYHMGESGTSTSLARFKRGFGAMPHQYAEYRLEALPLTRADRRLRGFVKGVLRFKDAS